MQDIDFIEGVQFTFTRNLYRHCHLEHVTYDERLHFLGLKCLELRRIHIDLIFMFKLIRNMLAISLSQSLQFTNHTHATRGHKYKLATKRCNKIVFSNHFINRVTPVWNFLSDICFAIDSLQSFKNRLYSLDFTWFLCGRL